MPPNDAVRSTGDPDTGANYVPPGQPRTFTPDMRSSGAIELKGQLLPEEQDELEPRKLSREQFVEAMMNYTTESMDIREKLNAIISSLGESQKAMEEWATQSNEILASIDKDRRFLAGLIQKRDARLGKAGGTAGSTDAKTTKRR